MIKNPQNQTIVYISRKLAIKLWGRVAQWANDKACNLKAVSSIPRRSDNLYTPTHVGKNNGESDAAKHNKQMEASVAVKHH